MFNELKKLLLILTLQKKKPIIMLITGLLIQPGRKHTIIKVFHTPNTNKNKSDKSKSILVTTQNGNFHSLFNTIYNKLMCTKTQRRKNIIYEIAEYNGYQEINGKIENKEKY